MPAKANAAFTAPSRTFISISAACDEKAMDHGDGRPRGRRPRAAAPADARRHSIIAERVAPSRSRVQSLRRFSLGRYAAAVGVLGQADATSPAVLPLASDGPGGLRDRNQLRAPRTVARLPPTGADLGPDSVNALAVSAAACPFAMVRAGQTTSSAPGKITARSGSQGGAGSAGWRESPRQEREDWVTTVRAALSAGQTMIVTLHRGAGSPIVPKVQCDHPTGR